MVPFPDARILMLSAVAPLESETVTLLAANGRVAAQALRATADIVPYARSAMDGYAVIAAETSTASRDHPYMISVARDRPHMISVADEMFAGDGPMELAARHAIKIATGAQLSGGADAGTTKPL